ncbi:MAG: hypothetical protein JW929_11375 [Anaerolineales bacterium]|nr:hypothetical protein [Anaerolineales bacterium]
MPTADLDSLLAAIVPVPGLHAVSGGLQMAFDGNAYTYYSDEFVLRMDFGPGQYMEATSSFRNTGTYTANDEIIQFDSASVKSGVSEWTAYKDGAMVSAPGAGP